MSIKVSRSTYHISPPRELEIKLENLVSTAAFAQFMGNTSLFNQAKEAYHKLGNDWYDRARREAEKKSYTNWLGGGETYIVFNPLNWDYSFDIATQIIKQCAKKLTHLQQELAVSYLVNNLSESSALSNILIRFQVL